ncbi:hypothetical protein MVEN_00469700 [Mycena venus]|uniref:Uncharacterized protein n=1 Tax=Mycena venus TaxID=2733690 RepID=A0A8H6YRL2_9AGAR|nr:hypothetical protein MVEN_00469700 [Mycena venus]
MTSIPTESFFAKPTPPSPPVIMLLSATPLVAPVATPLLSHSSITPSSVKSERQRSVSSIPSWATSAPRSNRLGSISRATTSPLSDISEDQLAPEAPGSNRLGSISRATTSPPSDITAGSSGRLIPRPKVVQYTLRSITSVPSDTHTRILTRIAVLAPKMLNEARTFTEQDPDGYRAFKEQVRSSKEKKMKAAVEAVALGLRVGDAGTPPSHRDRVVNTGVDRFLQARIFPAALTSSSPVSLHTRCLTHHPQCDRTPSVETVMDHQKLQPFIHDFVLVVKHGSTHSHFRVFLKHHKRLPQNRALGIQGDLLVLRVAAKNPDSVVNIRSSDRKRIDTILKKIVPHLVAFQGPKRKRLPQINSFVLWRFALFPSPPPTIFISNIFAQFDGVHIADYTPGLFASISLTVVINWIEEMNEDTLMQDGEAPQLEEGLGRHREVTDSSSKKQAVAGPSRNQQDALREQLALMKEQLTLEKRNRKAAQDSARKAEEAAAAAERVLAHHVTQFETECREHYEQEHETVLAQLHAAQARAGNLEIQLGEERMRADEVVQKTIAWQTQHEREIIQADEEAAAVQTEHQKQMAEKNSEIQVLMSRLRTTRGSAPAVHQQAFPNGQPQLRPQFVSQSTVDQRSLERVIRTSSDRFPIVPLQPPPSASSLSEAPSAESLPHSVETYDIHDPSSRSELIELIADVVNKMRPVVVEVSNKAKGCRRKRTETLAAQVRDQQAKMSREDDCAYKTGLRALWDRVTETTHAHDFQHYMPAAEDLVEACNNGRRGPAEDDFTPRLHTWVHELREEGGGWQLPPVTDAYIEGELYGQLKRSHVEWSRWQPKFSMELGREENEAEIRARAEASQAQRQAQSDRRTLKSRKLDRRQKTVVKMISIRTVSGAADLEFWRFLQRVLKYLGIGGMSSEEGDTQNVGGYIQSVYKVKLCVWRSTTITDYLRIINERHAKMRTRRGNEGHRRLWRVAEVIHPAVAPNLKGARHPFSSRTKPEGCSSSIQYSRRTWRVLVIPQTLNQRPRLLCDHESKRRKTPPSLPPGVIILTFGRLLCPREGKLYGSVRSGKDIYMVHHADPTFIRHLPTREQAPPLRPSDISGNFWAPSFVNLHTAYIMFIPKDDPWHGSLLGRLRYTFKTLPIVNYDEGGWGLAASVVEEWRALELNLRAVVGAMLNRCKAQRPYISSYASLYRFGYEHLRHTELEARRIALRSIYGFLPLIGELSMFFLLFRVTEDVHGGAGWRCEVAQTAGVDMAWFNELEATIAFNDLTPRIGGIIDFTIPDNGDHPEILPRSELGLILGSIIAMDLPIPLYIKYGKINSPPSFPLPPTLRALDFFPNELEIAYLNRIPGDVAYSPWVESTIVARDYPGALRPAPWRGNGHLRKASNDAYMLKETPQQKTARLQREAHAATGQVPGKSSKAARVFVWEEIDGNLIRQAVGRKNYEDRWDDFTPSQRVYDSIHNEWDLCENFGPLDDQDLAHDDWDDYGLDDEVPLLPDNDNLTQTGPHTSQSDLHRIFSVSQSKPDPPLVFEILPAERQAYLQFGYIASGAATAATQIPLPTFKVTAKALGDKDLVLPANDTRLRTFFAQLKNASRLDMISPDLLDFHSPSSDINQVWEMDVASFVHAGITYYVVKQYDTPGPFVIVLSNATATLEIVRNGWGPDIASVARQLFLRGIPFQLCIKDSIVPLPREDLYLKRYSGLGYRPQGYQPNLLDYAAYTNFRDRFLMTARGHAALRYGGVVARIARAVLTFEDALLGPSDDVTYHGVHLINKRFDETYWDDQLTADELDLICGVYHVATGQTDPNGVENQQTTTISWWPRPVYFEKSGLNVGWWSPACEAFYQRRLSQINHGDATLCTQGQWKNNMKFDSKVPAYIEGAERCAAQILGTVRP